MAGIVINDEGINRVQPGSIVQASLGANVAGTGPAFKYYSATSQGITSGAETKVLVATPDYDTNNSVTSSTFTAVVAGYYHFDAILRGQATGLTQIWAYFKVNAVAKAITVLNVSASTSQTIPHNDNFYLHAGDTVELWGGITGTSPSFSATANVNTTSFSGFLARAA